MAALAGVFADIQLSTLPGVALSGNHAMIDSGDHQTFQLAYNSPFRAFDKTGTFTFQTSPDGSTGWTNTAYTSIGYSAGKVTFAAPVVGSLPSARTNAGKYFVLASIGNSTEWAAQLAAKSIDATTHKGVGGSAWEDYQLTTLGGKVTMKKWWIDETFINHIIARDLLVLSLLDPLGDHYDAYGYFTDDSVKLAVAGLIEEDLSFTAVDAVSFL